MTDCNHYDCEYFRAFDDGIGVDLYCVHHKKWFFEDDPICEDFKEDTQ